MHSPISGKGDPVEAPGPVQRAKNLIEEFFGLTVADGAYCPPQSFGPVDESETFCCRLMSPSVRPVAEFSLEVGNRPSEGWVTLHFPKGFITQQWGDALQIAINNFINNTEGGLGVLGESKPDPGKLLSGR